MKSLTEILVKGAGEIADSSRNYLQFVVATVLVTVLGAGLKELLETVLGAVTLMVVGLMTTVLGELLVPS